MDGAMSCSSIASLFRLQRTFELPAEKRAAGMQLVREQTVPVDVVNT